MQFGELLLGLPYLRNHCREAGLRRSSELLLGLRYFRNYARIKGEDVIGELLLGLRFLRNKARSTNFSSRVSYCLIYGISETR